MSTSELFHNGNVCLTALTRDDAATIARWQMDSEFMRLLDSIPAYPRSEAYIADKLEEERKKEGEFHFAIRHIENNDLIGIVSLEGIEWSNQVGWLSIGIGDRVNWGKGHGYHAMKLVLDYAFRELNLHRVQLTVFSYNERAIALYEKLGFQREGAYREYLHRDGKRHDMYLYGLLRMEWESREAE